MHRALFAAALLASIPVIAPAQIFFIPIPQGDAIGPPVPITFEFTPAVDLTVFYQDKGAIQEASCRTPCVLNLPARAPLRMKVQGPPGYSGYKKPPELKWIMTKDRGWTLSENPVRVELRPIEVAPAPTQ